MPDISHDPRLAALDAEIATLKAEMSTKRSRRNDLLKERQEVWSVILAEAGGIQPGDLIEWAIPWNTKDVRRGRVIQLGGYPGSIHYTVHRLAADGTAGTRTEGVPPNYKPKKV